MIAQLFNGLFAPVGTPKLIIDKVASATSTVMKDKDFQDTLIKSGFEPVLDSNPDKARAFVSEIDDKVWFYDRAGWRDYLDMLVAARFNAAIVDALVGGAVALIACLASSTIERSGQAVATAPDLVPRLHQFRAGS
jgi:hypothetical protein